jgi:hypothetical protein
MNEGMQWKIGGTLYVSLIQSLSLCTLPNYDASTERPGIDRVQSL